MFDNNSLSNLHSSSIDCKVDKKQRRSSRWDTDSDTKNEPKTPRRDTMEPKTPRRVDLYDDEGSRWDSDSDTKNEPKTPRRMESKTPRRVDLFDDEASRWDSDSDTKNEPKTPRRNTMEPKTPRRVDLYDANTIIAPKINIHRNEFESTIGDHEELEDVPWRKHKSDSSKNMRFDEDVNEKTAYGKWFDSEKNQPKEQAKKPPTTETTLTDELLDENYPNVKPSAIEKKSLFGFSSRKPVKLFMEEKSKKSEQLSQQHVFALDDTPEHSPVEDRRVLDDDDVMIVTKDIILDDTTNQSRSSKLAPPPSKPSESQRIPVLEARPSQPSMMQQSNPTFFPLVSASGPSVFSNQRYRPPTNFVDVNSSDHDICSYRPPSYPLPSSNDTVISPAEFFITTQSSRPASFNNFATTNPPARSWIPSTNPTLPSSLQVPVASSSQYIAPASLSMPAEVSTTKSTATSILKDAVKEEMQQQNRNLLMQKQEYVERLRLLTDEMAKLKSKKKELLEGRKTHEKEQFLKENNRLQTEIQSKITAVENVIDMLSNMVARNGVNSKTELKNIDSQEPKDDNVRKSSSAKNKKAKRSKHSRSSSRSPRSRARSRVRQRSQSKSESRSPKSRARSRVRQHSPSKSKSRSPKSRARSRIRQRSPSKSKSHSPKSRARSRVRQRSSSKSKSPSPKSRARSRIRQRSPSKSKSRSRSRQRSKMRRKSVSRSPRKHRSRRSRSQDSHHQKRHTPEKRSKSIIARKNEDQKSSSPAAPLKTSAVTRVEATTDTRRETYTIAGKRDESTNSGVERYSERLKIGSGLSQKKMDETKTSSTETTASVKKTAPETNRLKQINYVYYDPETHWCRVCNVFPQTAKEYLTHLHSVEHKTEMTNRGVVDYPWHKAQAEVKNLVPPNAPTERVPIRGLQFFVSATAWYCKLCSEFMGDLHCASVHLKSDHHQRNLSTFLSERPSWEDEWLRNRTRAYEEYSRKLCDSQADVFTCALPPVLSTTANVTTATVTPPSPNAGGSKAVDVVNGNSRSIDTNHVCKDESRSKNSDRGKECSKLKDKEKPNSRGRVRSKSKSIERSKDQNRSKGRDHSRGRNRSRDREQLRGRDRSKGRDQSQVSTDQRGRPKHDKSASASKYRKPDSSRSESNHSRDSIHKSSNTAANTKLSNQSDEYETVNDGDEFVKEWIPLICSTSKEKEFADLRDKLRYKKEDEKNRKEKEKKDERCMKDSKRHADKSPSKVTSVPNEKRAKKTDDLKSKNDQPTSTMKMQPIFIRKGTRFPFIGKMPSRSSRKNDPNATPAEKMAEIAAAANKKSTKAEQHNAEHTEPEPDKCNTVVDMDVNDVEDVPIVTEMADEVATRKKDFDETLKILYPEVKSPQQDSASSQPMVENVDRPEYLLSLFTSTMLETMKQLPNQKGSLDTSTVVDLMTTMSKTLLTVGQNAQNSTQLRISEQPAPVESEEKSKRGVERISTMKKRIENSRPAATEIRGSTKRKNAMSQKRRRSLRKVRERLQEQEKQLQEKIDETKKNLQEESFQTSLEKEINPESIPMPAHEMEVNNSVPLPELECDTDLMLLGIEEGDSAALQF